jgi:hypothetical protein
MGVGNLSKGGLEDQLAEHPEGARAHGEGHPAALAVNRTMSFLIVTVYRALRLRRRLGPQP